MPSISKPISVDPRRRRARVGFALWTIALAGLAAWGFSRVSPSSEGGARTVTVKIENMMFSPNVVKVRRGDRVIFENRDLVPHTATAKGLFDSGIIKAGESWSIEPTKTGTLRYACQFHPTMEGSLVVEAP